MEKFIEDKNEIVPENFGIVADLLLNKTLLIANDTKFRICEIEFFLHEPDHEDIFCSRHKDQLRYGKFYFHKTSKNNYKSATFKGLDLSAGNKGDNKYCSIAIRSIYNIKKEEFIEGPCRIVNAILKEYDCVEIMDLTGGDLLSVLENDKDLIIKDTKKLKHKTIYVGERYKLNVDKSPKYKKKKYRFMIMKEKIKNKIDEDIKKLEIEKINEDSDDNSNDSSDNNSNDNHSEKDSDDNEEKKK